MESIFEKWIINKNPKEDKNIKKIYYLNWEEKNNPIAIFQDIKPDNYDFSKKINWKIEKKTIELYIYGVFNKNDNKIKKNNPPNYNIPFIKSHLQKCVRRNLIQKGIDTAYTLISLDYNEFMRRLPIIILEDSMLIESFPVIIWLMVVSSDYKIEYEYQLKWILSQIYLVIESPIKDYRSKLDYNLFENIININQLNEKQLSIIYSIELRKSFGGMKGDMQMLGYFQKKWLDRFKKKKDIYIENQYLDINYENILFENIEKSAIDFHCFPNILKKMGEKYKNIPKNDLKKLIWIKSAGINLKNEIDEEINNSIDNIEYNIEEWKKIKKDYEKLQNYYYQNRLFDN